MVAVASEIYANLGIAVGASEAAIRDAIAAQPAGILPIFSSAGTEALVAALIANDCKPVKLLRPFTQVETWRYATITQESSRVAQFLFCPLDGFGHP